MKPTEFALAVRRLAPGFRSVLNLVLLAGLAGVLAPSIRADRDKPDSTKTQLAPLMPAPPVIDGVIDAEEWQFANGSTGNWRVTADPNSTNGLRGGVLVSGPAPFDNADLSYQIYAGYDSNHLYIALRVTDSILFDDSAAADSANGNTWEDDSVEVFVDALNANPAAWSTNQPGGQYVITINNAYRQMEAGNPGYGPEAAWYAKATWTDTGYDAEFRISLATLANPKLGDVLGFTIAVNDDDGGGAIDNTVDRQVTWVGTPHQPVTYGNLILGYKVYRAPLVSAAPVLDGTINPNEYASAQAIPINPTTGAFQLSAGGDTWPPGDMEAVAWAVHDDEAIYVAVSVTDDLVVTDTAEAGSEDGNTWEDDSVEIFFDADRDRNRGGPTLDFEGQFVLTANGAHRDNEARNPTFGQNDDWFAAASTTTNGYQVEFKVKKTILLNPTNGTVMGFNIALNDDDATAGRKAQLNWNGDPHQEYTYGDIVLAGPGLGELKFTSVKMNPNGTMTLEWMGGGMLQSAPAASGPWADVSAATSPYNWTPAGQNQFWRLKR